MKINIPIAAVTAAVLVVLSAAGVYIYQNFFKSEAAPGEAFPAANEQNPTADGEEVLGESKLIKDDFEITLPPGWQAVTNPPEGVLAMAIDTKEDVSGGNFQKLEFQTNFSIKSDNYAAYAGISGFEGYVESVKTSLVQMLPSVSFTKEEQKTINGNRAILIECSSRQEEADFKTVLVFVEGADGAVYAISLNTFQDSWKKYGELFYRIAESFKIKYQIGP